MNGRRLKQLRLARGLSLEDLAAALGGLVSRQGLWKYEHDKAQPSAIIANRIADVVGVKAINLVSEPEIHVEMIAYRKRSSLTKTEMERIASIVSLALEERVRLQDRLGLTNGGQHIPTQYSVKTLADAEAAASDLRKRWSLGKDAIANVVAVLEDHHIHVLEIEADSKFDGISAVARDPKGEVIAAAVVTNRGIPGERQRLNIAHELGHILLRLASDLLDEEAAAFRFAAAFLLPAETLIKEVGVKRRSISFAELLIVKRRFGVSVQAILHRMCKDLEIITEAHYKQWCIEISASGYRKAEPGALEAERPQWLRRNVLRALAEGLMTTDEANAMSIAVEDEVPLQLDTMTRRAFFKLPMAERKRILAAQAEKMEAHYKSDEDWKDLGGVEIVEY